MIPKKFEPVLFGLILSAIMSALVSGIATFRAAQPGAPLLELWALSWLTAWLFAFPCVLLAAPLTRHVVRKLVASA